MTSLAFSSNIFNEFLLLEKEKQENFSSVLHFPYINNYLQFSNLWLYLLRIVSLLILQDADVVSKCLRALQALASYHYKETANGNIGLGSHAVGLEDSSGKIQEGLLSRFLRSLLQLLLFEDYRWECKWTLPFYPTLPMIGLPIWVLSLSLSLFYLCKHRMNNLGIIWLPWLDCILKHIHMLFISISYEYITNVGWFRLANTFKCLISWFYSIKRQYIIS